MLQIIVIMIFVKVFLEKKIKNKVLRSRFYDQDYLRRVFNKRKLIFVIGGVLYLKFLDVFVDIKIGGEVLVFIEGQLRGRLQENLQI